MVERNHFVSKSHLSQIFGKGTSTIINKMNEKELIIESDEYPNMYKYTDKGRAVYDFKHALEEL